MSLYKRGTTWWIDFTTPSGERIRRSASTEHRAQAQELHDQLKADAWRIAKLGDKPRRTWDEAAIKWLHEMSHKATHAEDKAKIRWLTQHLTLRYLDEIDREVIDELGRRRAEETSLATTNRYLALLRAILRKACFEWEWTERVPKIRMNRERKRRVRWLTPEQARGLLAELPVHQRDVVLFALSTGLRQGNVIGLEWSQVDLDRRIAWIYGDQAKGGYDIHVPLNGISLGVLTGQVGKHPTRVFTYKGRPIAWANTRAWREALKRAGIADFRWHDLRHTWASWHAQHGTPLYALQEMGAWQSEQMVRRYAHLAPSHLASHSDALADAVSGQLGLLDDTTAAQPQTQRAQPCG